MPYQVILHKGALSVLDGEVMVGSWGAEQREAGLIQLGVLVGNVPDAVSLLAKAKTACCTNCASGKACAGDEPAEDKAKTAYDMSDEELLEMFNHVKDKVSAPKAKAKGGCCGN